MGPFNPPVKTGTILLVDDEPDLRQIIAEGLEMSGYVVVQAATAEEGLAFALDGHGFALAISDVRLPGMSGVELADRFAQADLSLRTILISGYFVPQAIRSRLISKPFTMRELEAAIRSELAIGAG